MNVFLLSFVALVAGPSAPETEDLQTAFENLKQAEVKKDAGQVKKLAAETCALARKVIATPAPAAPDEKQEWSTSVANARTIELYTEYALFSMAVAAQPATTVDLVSTLEQQNPKSKYLDDAYGRYFLALSQTGAAAKIPAIAEKAIARFPENEDLLLVLTDTALNRKQSDRAGAFAERLIVVLSKHPRPEGMSAADWERKKTAALGRAYWTAGLIHSEKGQYFQADEDLRAALPLIKGQDSMRAAALFHLGVANYQVGRQTLNRTRVLDGVRFSDEAAAIPGPYAQQAWTNSRAMRLEAERMRGAR